jgi:predicted Zn-dependent protease
MEGAKLTTMRTPASSGIHPAEKEMPSYRVGVMMMDVEGKDSDNFAALVLDAVDGFEEALSEEQRLRINTFAFPGPHLNPGAGAYAPLDFLEMGLAEKIERDVQFLLIVTEVDLSSSSLAYTVALPSQLTNVAVLSSKRLDPGFWGGEADPQRASRRLAALLLHSFGHLLNLPHRKSSDNVMYPLERIEDLDQMRELCSEQLAVMRKMLPREAHERSTRTGKFGFVLSVLGEDVREILRATVRANPFRLVLKMPTMLAAALSVTIILLFSPEIWDVASTVSASQITLFSGVSLITALFVLYRAFAFQTLLSRDRLLTETAVVTATVTILSLMLTLLVMFAGFALAMYAGIVTVFPARLMETWPTVDPAIRTIDHVKMSLFLASMGVLAGSLGGRSDSRDLVRSVLFIDEES